MDKVRIALIGAGGMGRKYAEYITQGQAEHLVLSSVTIRREELLPWANQLVNQDATRPRIYSNTEELFSHPEEYDAVLIVTPHKTHPEFACRAFALGKHVLCDKPAGATIGEAKRMAEAAKKSGKLYAMMFHQRRYEKYKKLKELLEDGETVGELKRVMLVNSRYFRTAHYHASADWRSSWSGEGGGALINQGQHILDIWQWLFGMPEQIYAEIPFGKYNEFLVDDEVTMTMRYPNKMTASFFLTTGEAVWEEKMEIVGTKGKIILEDDTLRICRYSCDSVEYIKNTDVNSREKLEVTEEILSFEKQAEPYAEMLENFAQAILKENAELLYAPGDEAENALMLTNAAYYSAWTGKRVELPLDPEQYVKEYSTHFEGEEKE